MTRILDHTESMGCGRHVNLSCWVGISVPPRKIDIRLRYEYSSDGASITAEPWIVKRHKAVHDYPTESRQSLRNAIDAFLLDTSGVEDEDIRKAMRFLSPLPVLRNK